MGATCSACGGERQFVQLEVHPPMRSQKSVESLSQETFRSVGGAQPLTPEIDESRSES